VGERVLARLATGFGLLAALIVATGLYGLLSFVITRRTREIGIRVALGARLGNILGLILRQTLWLVGGGIAIGLSVSFFAARAMQALLFEVSTSDPSVFGGAAFLMLVVAGAAAMLPAFRVLGFEPAAALRCDG
jgi:putative ABC transport system permease protein